MKELIFILSSIIVTCASIDFDKVRPIEELLLQNPEKYPLWNTWNNLYGHTSVGRIAGGAEAIPGQFPYQCAQLIKGALGTYFCGCSIIGNKTILTAAHCVEDAISVEIILGAHYVFQNEPNQVRIKVPAANIKVHEKWDTRSIRNDIAVINLDNEIKFNERIQKINLPKYSERDLTFVGEKCTTSGWGRSSDSTTSFSPVLRWVDTSVMSNVECANIYGLVVTNTNICGTGIYGKSSCSGDSGGPMTVQKDNRLIQIGIVSFGASAGCELGYPHVYTRVTEYLEWIDKNSDAVIEK